ncbi:MAG: hypothetical protein FJW35_06185 [Acidobacteria bacterium]|nr:hypothetical protein [Acidobacteriota bacterium]
MMPTNCRETSRGGSAGKRRSLAPRLQALTCALLLGVLLQPACLFRKKKVDETKYPAAPLLCVVLPVNIPAETPDLRWVALASTAIIMDNIAAAQDLDAVPLWEAMPVALESVGPTRTTSPEAAGFLASRLAARWAIHGELLPAEKETKIRIDFIPSRASLVAYRFEARFSAQDLEGTIREAFGQFLRYLIARPLPKTIRSNLDAPARIAEALDQEYGWFVAANPGKAETVVSRLAQSHRDLAGLLFNPAVYPSLAAPAAPPGP